MDESVPVKIPAVRDPRVQAVAVEVVHLVDVDRPRKQRMHEPHGARIVPTVQYVQYLSRLDVPIFPQDAGQFAVVSQETGGEFLMGCKIRK